MAAIAAFFDMDFTLLKQSSGQLYLRYLWQNRLLTYPQLVQLAWWALLYKFSLLEFPRLMARLMAQVAGGREEETIAQAQAWFTEWVVPQVAEGGRQKVEEHRQQGHIPVLITASTPYAAKPLAEYLHLGDNYLCTWLEVKEGRFTGRLIEPPCYGPGKIVWARRFAEARQVDLTQSYFYTDGYSDRHLLAMVGHPIAVNPERKLRRLAAAQGWPVVYFY